MKHVVKWTDDAQKDLERIYNFLGELNLQAAEAVLAELYKATEILETMPRYGRRLDHLKGCEVRRLIRLDYEIRYEVVSDCVFIVALWHHKEHRE